MTATVMQTRRVIFIAQVQVPTFTLKLSPEKEKKERRRERQRERERERERERDNTKKWLSEIRTFPMFRGNVAHCAVSLLRPRR